MATYDFPILIDLSKSSAQVKSVIKRLNATLPTFGIPERITVADEIGVMTLSIDKLLTHKEVALVKILLRRELVGRGCDFALRIGEPRCKSGKSSSQPIAVE